MEIGSFPLGNITLVSGQRLTEARLAYRQWGQLSAARDNCIVLPAYYGGNTLSYEKLIGSGRMFDTDRYCVICPGLLGGGESTSPSNYAGAAGSYPLVDMRDNVHCQHRLLTEQFDIATLPLIAGWSLGGMQALYWAAIYPDQVKRVLAICATANCWPQNAVFLKGMESILCNAPEYDGAIFRKPPIRAVRTFARNYCGWAYAPAFFRKARYRELGLAALEDLLVAWEEDHLAQNPADLLAVLRTWLTSSFRYPDRGVSNVPDLYLNRITARTILLPSCNDSYFTMDEAILEGAEIPDVMVRVMHTDYGHCAGAPGRFADGTVAIAAAVATLLGPDA